MNFGLPDKHFDFLREYLIDPLKNLDAEVYIFGSRAIGKERPFSDIDILFKETTIIPQQKISQIISFFEESDFPYKIDLVNDRELAKSYRTNVEKQKIRL